MRFNSTAVFLLIVLFLSGCSDKEEVISIKTDPYPMTLIINDSFLNQEDSIYFMISKADGAFLDGKWQCGPGTVVFNPPMGVQWPDSVTLTEVRISGESMRVPSITSFYRLPGGSYKFSGACDLDLIDAKVNLVNMPSLRPGSTGVVTSGFSSRIFYPSAGNQFIITAVPTSDRVYVKIEKESGEGVYKLVSVVPPINNLEIDLQDALPLQNIEMRFDPGVTPGNAAIYGSFEDEPHSMPLYLLDYNDYLESNDLVWYPSGSLFSSFYTSVSGYRTSDNATLSFETLGDIPTEFTTDNATFSFESTQWPLLSWHSTVDFDMSFAAWYYDVSANQGLFSYRIYWRIYGPGLITRYEIPELPSEVASIINIDTEQFTRASVTLVRFTKQTTYYSWLREQRFANFANRKLVESTSVSKGFGLKNDVRPVVFSPSFPELLE